MVTQEAHNLWTDKASVSSILTFATIKNYMKNFVQHNLNNWNQDQPDTGEGML